MDRVLALQHLEVRNDGGDTLIASTTSIFCQSKSRGGCHVTETGIGDA
jgi:hypothetical protein